ncbi:MAG: 16S rRNA (guanine(966)-N(2))-methyltransferase RsmD [Verrucomicrobia bacterium]|nr:16S rRNA (guanine(966)-N(2))-methyltransferase RsmD [Verrucomicrobiota bacterium]
MKIIAGEFRSRVLSTPPGVKTRPTMSQVRARVFNICQESVADCRFLDICAGSGSMGLEAISRGASSATFIEQSRDSAEVIRHNIQLLGVADKSHLLCQEASLALQGLISKNKCFDICYLDPPYGSQVGTILSLLDTSSLLVEGAYFFMERNAKTPLDISSLQHLQLKSSRRVGDTLLYCFRRPFSKQEGHL